VFILRSVVGKLWMTIIGLVAVVIIMLGSFLIPYIENYFSETKDQTNSLYKLAKHIADEAGKGNTDAAFDRTANELVSYQQAHMILLSKNLDERQYPQTSDQPPLYRAVDFFSQADLGKVFAGASLDNSANTGNKTAVSPHAEYLAVAVPIMTSTTAHDSKGAVILYQPLLTHNETSSYVIRLFVYVGIIGFSLTTVFALFLFYRITQPLLRLKKAAGLISMGEYGIRVPIVSTDEIGDLAKTFNKMVEELQETIKAHSQEKEHLASVLRSMTDAVITFDAEGCVMLTNPQGGKIIREWGDIGNWDEPSGSEEGSAEMMELPSSSVPEPLQPLFAEVVGNAKEITGKIHVRSDVWSVVMTPLYEREGVRGAVAVLRNVTEEFRLDKLRTDFVANVSHELRTPLSMLQGYSEALIDDIAGTPEERKELAQVIYDESLRMSRLVRDLLDLARMESGHMEMHFREIDILSLLRRMQRKFTVLAKDRGITLELTVSDEPLILRSADEDRLEQVMTNLLDNAIRHTPPNASIVVKAYETKPDGQTGIAVEIADEGAGIPAEDLPYIFERFYKADKARTRGMSGGTGLGLAIVMNIIDAHKGTVRVKSSIGLGTTFTIFLPQINRSSL
jgi:two-component system, OmpR family, sensor histidine kinase ResE